MGSVKIAKPRARAQPIKAALPAMSSAESAWRFTPPSSRAPNPAMVWIRRHRRSPSTASAAR